MANNSGFEETASLSLGSGGHRARLRQRFKTGGSTSLADYELLELLLFRFIPRRDTKPIAKSLLNRFGSIAEVLAAPIERLQEIDGVGETVALDLKVVLAAAQKMTKDSFEKRQVLSSRNALLDYCQVTMAFAEKEQFRIIFLDKRNGLIADEVQQEGTVDHTPVYPREIVKRALELSASAIILVHNHPSGDPTPSTADISMTHKIIEISSPLGITVHDHLIIGKDDHASLRALKLI